MSGACRKLLRIWQTTATRIPAIEPIRPSPAAMDELYKEPDLDVLVSKFKQLSSSFYFRSNHAIYSYTIARLASQKRFSSIAEIIEAHKKYDIIARECYAVRLISLYGHAGMFEHAHNLFDELPKLNCERTDRSLTSLMASALNCKKFETVVEIFRSYTLELGIVPGVGSYNTVIRALGEMGLLDEAISMVEEMEIKGLKPNLVTFNSLIMGAYMKKGYSEGENIWHWMLERTEDLVPGIRSYNVKLQALINEGMIFDAVDLLEDLKTKGLKPNIISYNLFIKGFCDHKDLEEAKKWYINLLENGSLPNGHTFNALVRLLCNDGDSALAFDLSKRVLGRYCFFVDRYLLQMVVDTLVKDLKIEEAKSLVKLARSDYNLVVPSKE